MDHISLIQVVVANSLGTSTSVTRAYNTEVGYTASTTGNISGVYDMSGGAWEYVMGYNTKASTTGGDSGITALYSDFFTNAKWNQYYDKYTSTSDISYNNRILGDATGEMGPFASISSNNINQYTSNWYNDYSYFVNLAILDLCVAVNTLVVF